MWGKFTVVTLWKPQVSLNLLINNRLVHSLIVINKNHFLNWNILYVNEGSAWYKKDNYHFTFLYLYYREWTQRSSWSWYFIVITDLHSLTRRQLQTASYIWTED